MHKDIKVEHNYTITSRGHLLALYSSFSSRADLQSLPKVLHTDTRGTFFNTLLLSRLFPCLPRQNIYLSHCRLPSSCLRGREPVIEGRFSLPFALTGRR